MTPVELLCGWLLIIDLYRLVDPEARLGSTKRERGQVFLVPLVATAALYLFSLWGLLLLPASPLSLRLAALYIILSGALLQVLTPTKHRDRIWYRAWLVGNLLAVSCGLLFR